MFLIAGKIFALEFDFLPCGKLFFIFFSVFIFFLQGNYLFISLYTYLESARSQIEMVMFLTFHFA